MKKSSIKIFRLKSELFFFFCSVFVPSIIFLFTRTLMSAQAHFNGQVTTLDHYLYKCQVRPEKKRKKRQRLSLIKYSSSYSCVIVRAHTQTFVPRLCMFTACVLHGFRFRFRSSVKGVYRDPTRTRNDLIECLRTQPALQARVAPLGACVRRVFVRRVSRVRVEFCKIRFGLCSRRAVGANFMPLLLSLCVLTRIRATHSLS